MHSVAQRERRRTRRVRMKQTLRVRPADPKDGRFEEVGTTKDISQDGVYFVTQRENYYEAMPLFVMVPYDSSTRQLNYEYLGQVARIDDVGNGQKGIAVRFRSSAAKKSSNFKF